MFQPLDFVKLKRPPATVATTATNRTHRVQVRPNVASVANVASPDPDDSDDANADPVAVDERAGLAADRVPRMYLNQWAQLNCRKPASVSEAEWRQALDDGGRFLDAFGAEAANAGWTPSGLFGVRAGLVWRLSGERVEAIGHNGVRLSGGRTFARAHASDHRGVSDG
jgi:hypothetical protein